MRYILSRLFFILLLSISVFAQEVSNLELTKDEIKWIKNNSVKVGGEVDWPPFDFVKDGVYQGIAKDIIELISKKTGLKVSYVTGQTWSELVDDFKNGKLDVMPALYQTKEREEFTIYTKSYLNIRDYAFIKEGDNSIANTNDLRDKKIALIDGYALEENLKEKFPDIDLLKVDSATAGIDAVLTNKADVYIDAYPTVMYLLSTNAETGLKAAFHVDFYANELRIGIQKSKPILASIMQKGLNSLSPNEKTAIFKKWTAKKEIELELTKEEKAWLDKNIPIKYVYDSKWEPFEWKNEFGDHTGVVYDILSLVEQRTGIDFQQVPTKNWSEAISLMKDGKADMFSGIGTNRQSDQYLNFSKNNIFKAPYVFVSRMNDTSDYTNTFQALKNKKAALVKGYTIDEILKEKKPNIPIISLDTIEEGFNKVRDKSLDIFIINAATATYFINKKGYDDLKIAAQTKFDLELKIALQKKFPKELISIIDKGIESISNKEMSDIYHKWTEVTIEEKTDWTLLFEIVGVGLLLIAFMVYNNRKLKALVNEKTAQLQSTLKSFDAHVIASNTDLKGKITYVSDAFCEISGYSREELLGKPHNISRHPDMPKDAFKDLWKTIKAGKVWSGEVKNIKKDGGFYWVDAIVSPLFDAKNEIIGYSSIRHDITDKKSVEELSLQQATQMQEIERSNRLLNGRENRMIELKEQINECKIKLGEDPIYTPLEVDELQPADEVDVVDEKEVDLAELLNIKDIQVMMDKFYAMNNIVQAIVDLDGNIIAQSKWQKACTNFHRANPDSCKRCLESDTGLANELDVGEKFTAYKCKNGLIDCASPIHINGKHVANFFIGQFLINEPDLEYFKAQAKLFSYDEEEYLESIVNLPVISEDKLPAILEFLVEITDVVTSISMQNKKAQKNEHINQLRALEMQNAQKAALNLAEDAEKARKEVENYKNHLETLVHERTQELQLAQEQFSSMVSNVPGAIYRVKDDSAWPIIYMSDEIKNITGYMASEFMESKIVSFSTIMYPDDVEPIGKIIQEQFKAGRKFQVDYRVIAKSGDIVWVRSQGQSVKSESGEAYIDGVLIDITEQKELEYEIAQNQDQMTYVSQYANLGFWTFNPQIGDLLVNDIFVQMLGYDPKEVLAQGFENQMFKPFKDGLAFWEQLLHPDDAARTGEIITAHINGETDLYKVDYRMKRADGSWMWSTAVGKINEFDEEGKPIKFNGVNLDIDEAKRAQEEIEEQSAFIDSIMNTQENFVLTSDGKVLRTANRAFFKFYGVNDTSEFIEKYGNCICDTFYKDAPQEYIQKFMGEETWIEYIYNRPSQVHKAIIKKDEQEYIFSITTDKVVFKGEELKTAVLTDITYTENAKKEIEAIHKHTRDSIEYASLIQQALIPEQDSFKKYFDDFFTIWQPKDTVGGDIYLFEELRDKDECLLMVIDCTGHGVPGAFVTMLVKAIERQLTAYINNSDEVVSPAKLLSLFNKSMKHLLKQESIESVSNAGFDGGIIYYNKKEKILKFSGAETALFYIEDDELKTIKGSRHSVGYKKSDANYEFKEHTIEIKDGMKFYLTTDGYLDQNGGEKGFPFGKKQFTRIVEQNKTKLFEQQKEILLEELIAYQKDEERNDDVTVVGFKI